MNKIISIIILTIFFISFITASCTVTLDKEAYIAGETATAIMSCSTNPEKNTAYTLNWTNQSGYQFELDTGTTPSVAGTNFYQTYIIPSPWPDGVWLNASLYGVGLSVTQNDSANVSSTGSANSLIITNIGVGDKRVGLKTSLKAVVKDENGKKISGGVCRIGLLSNDETSVRKGIITTMTDGGVKGIFDLTPGIFLEETDYNFHIHCFCGSDGSSQECIDEDGNSIEDSVGSTDYPFTTDRWLNVNTITDESLYSLKDEIFVCANTTNTNYPERIPLNIYYEIRCSANNDNNGDTDRTLIAYNKMDDPDMRGISTNTTQMQCRKFVIPEENYLMGQNSECYASSEVWVLDSTQIKIFGYSTTSPLFNISSDELNLQGDWQWIYDTKINSLINLSNYANINGQGTGNVDVRLDFPNEAGVELYRDLSSLNIFENITVYNLTGILTEHVDYELEILEDGFLELEIRNVNLSSNWWNITIDFYNTELRQTQALEGINNKTGTFHLDVDCPSSATIGGDMNCVLTAYIEDPQLVQKEVDFTCYLSDGTLSYSSLNFNQMITKNAISISKTFAVPSSFESGRAYLLQCHADYYNFGSRRDSFYDTFYATTGVGGGSSAGITGGVIDEGEDTDEGKKDDEKQGTGEDKKTTINEIINKFNPLSPTRSWALIFSGGIFIIGIILLIILFLKRKKKKSPPSHETKKGFNKKTLLKISIIFFGIIILISLITGVMCIINYMNSSFNKGDSLQMTENYSILQDKLFRGIILTTFIILIIIILSKALNIRGDIKFGTENVFRKYDKKFKEQRKLNKEILKRELRTIKKKKKS